MVTLDKVDDDVLIYLFSFLSVPEILCVRQSCRRMNAISKLRIVWQNACTTHILQRGLPFPSLPLDSMSMPELEYRTCHAHRFSMKWLSDSFDPPKVLFFNAALSSCISDLRFMPGHDGKWLLTTFTSIWSVLCVWDISNGLRKVCQWSPRGAVLNGFALNTDATSEATIAISVSQDGSVVENRIEILSLQYDGIDGMLEPIAAINSRFKPIAMQGNILAFSDDLHQTIIWNWKDDKVASLREVEDDDFWQNRPIQVIFAHRSILIVRAHTISLFPEPVLQSSDDPALFYTPLARHSFGWIDGVAATLDHHSSHSQPEDSIPYPPLSILLRVERHYDPWIPDLRTLELYKLNPNPHFNFMTSVENNNARETEYADQAITISPYTFPPSLSSQAQSISGSLRCMDVVLGRYGTAVWIQPQGHAMAGLIPSDIRLPIPLPSTARETLVAAVFPGPLNSSTNGQIPSVSVVKPRVLWPRKYDSWTSLDYNEESGRIAIGSGCGEVTVLELYDDMSQEARICINETMYHTTKADPLW